ncbi:MAG: Gfo/Idh/MocA family oxidoreductase [Phycisphaerae bacterium]|jgi:predicted dehydrogenase|nr:Gfo/Idh/MocA family oxidoreductase [Phycisphaerae bacterium]
MSCGCSATKVYRTALIGCGMRGTCIALNAKNFGRYEIVAVADPDAANRTHTKKELGMGELPEYSDYKELLKWGQFEVVIIGSPDFVHETQAIDCMNAGKHLLLEKPIAISYDGGKRVVETALKTGRTVAVGFVLRYAPLYAKAKQLIEQGTIGKLTTMWVLHSVASGSDWYFHDWHASFANTGGLLLQKGSHDFDILNWFAGAQARQISAIGSRDVFGGDEPNDLTCPKCDKRFTCPERMNDDSPRVQCAFRKEVDCLDNHLVQIVYDNGVKASYNECHYTPDDNREYVFIGTKGKIVLNDADGKLYIKTRNTAMYKESMTFTPGNIDSGHGGGDSRLLVDLANAIEQQTQPLAGVQAGLEAIRVGLLAHESIRQNGKPLSSF